MPSGSETPAVPPSRVEAERARHVEQLLDEALAATFPASDPVALTPAEYPGVPFVPGMPPDRRPT